MDEALEALAQALNLAEPEGFVRIFLDEAALVSQTLIEPLSEREIEVLQRVAAGYANQEIADDLFLAVSTVKKHINNIYGKLEVKNRTEAVARAREEGLL